MSNRYLSDAGGSSDDGTANTGTARGNPSGDANSGGTNPRNSFVDTQPETEEQKTRRYWAQNSDILSGYQGYVPEFTGDKAAQKTRAWIANSEWLDYQSRYAPREEALVQRLGNEGAVEEINRRLGEIRGTAGASYASSLGDTFRRMARYGIGNSMSTEARTQLANEGGANMARSVIDAENNVRQHITDRNMNMIAGSGEVIHRDYNYGT